MEKIKASALVIDDQAEMLFLCSSLLGQVVTEVESAGSCKEAREAFHRRNFDLVLTDINIDADGDGIALAREVKNISPSTIVIIMTADPTIETAIGGLKSGASEYIIKPFSMEYLESVVRNAFEKAKLSSDLEREKALKAELQAAYTQLEAADRAKTAFLSRVNHELRTPLTIALTSSELLGRELKDEKSAGVWARSDRALRGLELVIEELLLFSGLLKGELKLERKETDMQTLLNETSSRLMFLYEEMGLGVVFSVEGTPYQVNCDPSLMREVFEHLLVNAVKFNKQGGGITVRSSYLPDRAVFSFSDTGSGVDLPDMPRLFDSFFQAADYLTREVGGVGLGLATVKRIVETHGGAAAAKKNAPGPGMTFSISLPRLANTGA